MTRRWTNTPNALDVPFNNATNGFTATDVQAAIEEAQSSAVGKLFYVLFSATGNTSDKWLGYGNGTTSSASIPLVLPFAGNLIGATFSNNDNDVDGDYQVFRNGILDGNLMYTWQIRNKRTAWITNINVTGFGQGDRVSLFHKNVTSGTGDRTAQDPIVKLIFSINPASYSEGGQQNGD